MRNEIIYEHLKGASIGKNSMILDHHVNVKYFWGRY